MQKKIKNNNSNVVQVTKVVPDISVGCIHDDELILSSADEVVIEPHNVWFVSTGVKIYLPRNTIILVEGLPINFINNNVYVHSTSQIVKTLNNEAIYHVCLKNDSNEPFVIPKNSQIVRLTFLRVERKNIIIN